MSNITQQQIRTPKSLWSESYDRLKKNKASVVSFWFIVVICLVALFAETLAPYPYYEQYIDDILASPNSKYLLGTDSLGRDMLSRLIYGARMSMAVGIFTAIISLFIGATYGAISGWFGGKIDAVLMRFVDILYSIPTLVLLILVKVIFDSLNLFEDPELKALTGILLALSVVGWVNLARVVRGQVLQVKEMTYVEAAKAMGASHIWILIKHVFPNILGPVIVLLTFQIPANILFESFLSFIGLGLQPPFSSWGVLANEGWRSLRSFPHLIVSPGIVLFLVMLSFNLFGDGLRDAFDPKMKK
ncbi:MAG: ABC transporter permease [Bdellovibrionaceae bacterium]|jgi:oligopeptide transport system permease protein|nr:ABC transporter permease [Pseudobdellovibrionaceae bacterium]